MANKLTKCLELWTSLILSEFFLTIVYKSSLHALIKLEFYRKLLITTDPKTKKKHTRLTKG